MLFRSRDHENPSDAFLDVMNSKRLLNTLCFETGLAGPGGMLASCFPASLKVGRRLGVPMIVDSNLSFAYLNCPNCRAFVLFCSVLAESE